MCRALKDKQTNKQTETVHPGCLSFQSCPAGFLFCFVFAKVFSLLTLLSYCCTQTHTDTQNPRQQSNMYHILEKCLHEKVLECLGIFL